MFSRTGQYRLTAHAIDPTGARRPLVTTAIAAAAGPRAGPYLVGADRWRMHDVARITLRRHLEEVAAIACGVAPRDAAAVEVRLEERASLDAPIDAHVTSRRCLR